MRGQLDWKHPRHVARMQRRVPGMHREGGMGLVVQLGVLALASYLVHQH